MENAYIFVIALMAILGGFATGHIWISIIFTLAVFLIIAFSGSKPEKKPEAVPMPLVRPIIVKRKYTGPASIYPSKMQIDYNPKDPPSKWKGKSESVGGFVGKGMRWLLKHEN